MLIAATLAVTTAVTHGLSLPPDFLPPSKYESVKEAPDVVLAVPNGVRRGPNRWEAEFQVTRSLKGKDAPPRVVVRFDQHHEPALGQTYVLFSSKPTNGYRVPLSTLPPSPTTWYRRTDSASVETLERYCKIAALANYNKEKVALRELQRNARAQPEKFPPGIAEEIELHFKTPSPYKSFEDLAEFYRLAAGEPEKDKSLNAMAQALHPQAFALIEPRLRHPVLRLRFLDYITKVDHPQRNEVLLRELIGTTNRTERAALARALAQWATKADNPSMLRALRACDGDDYSGATVAEWFVQNRHPAGTALMKEMMGPDYRRNTRFLRVVAMLGDEDVVRWAERAVYEADEGTRVRAVSVLAYSPTPSADATVRGMIFSGEAELLQLLVYRLASEDSNPHRWERLRDIAALPDKRLRSSLERTLQGRERPEAKELLRALDATSRPTATIIAPTSG